MCQRNSINPRAAHRRIVIREGVMMIILIALVSMIYFMAR